MMHAEMLGKLKIAMEMLTLFFFSYRDFKNDFSSWCFHDKFLTFRSYLKCRHFRGALADHPSKSST